MGPRHIPGRQTVDDGTAARGSDRPRLSSSYPHVGLARQARGLRRLVCLARCGRLGGVARSTRSGSSITYGRYRVLYRDLGDSAARGTQTVEQPLSFVAELDII